MEVLSAMTFRCWWVDDGNVLQSSKNHYISNFPSIWTVILSSNCNFEHQATEHQPIVTTTTTAAAAPSEKSQSESIQRPITIFTWLSNQILFFFQLKLLCDRRNERTSEHLTTMYAHYKILKKWKNLLWEMWKER